MAKGVKTGGRQKGTPNKALSKAAKTLEEIGCNPILEMVKIAEECMQLQDYQTAGGMYKELAQYVSPKLKAVEVTGADGGAIKHSHKVEWIVQPVKSNAEIDGAGEAAADTD